MLGKIMPPPGLRASSSQVHTQQLAAAVAINVYAIQLSCPAAAGAAGAGGGACPRHEELDVVSRCKSFSCPVCMPQARAEEPVLEVSSWQ